MLVIAALLMALYLALNLQEASTGATSAERLTASLREHSLGASQEREIHSFPQFLSEIAEVLAPQLMTQLWNLGLLAALARLFYVTHPLRLRRLQKPRPLDPEEAPSVVGYLRRCAESLERKQWNKQG
jgi:hypothetical protein